MPILPSFRRPVEAAFIACLMFCFVATAIRAEQPAAARPTTPTATNPTGGKIPASQRPKLNLDKLLADPVPQQPALHVLIERRHWLAHQEGKPEAFEQVAAEFEKA